MDKRTAGLILATSGTLAGALLARRTRPSQPQGTPDADLTGPIGRPAAPPAPTGRRSRRPSRFGWASHAPVPDAAARSRVRVRAGAPSGIFAPANAHPES